MSSLRKSYFYYDYLISTFILMFASMIVFTESFFYSFSFSLHSLKKGGKHIAFNLTHFSAMSK